MSHAFEAARCRSPPRRSPLARFGPGRLGHPLEETDETNGSRPMIDAAELEPGNTVYVRVSPHIIRLADVLAVDSVYEHQVAVQLRSTGALRTLPLSAVVERYPAGSEGVSSSSSTTSAS